MFTRSTFHDRRLRRARIPVALPVVLCAAAVLCGTAPAVRAQSGATGSMPATAAWNPVRSMMLDERWAPSACLLQDGRRALVAGGYSYRSRRCVATADLFDETSGTFLPSHGRMATPRDFATATLLPDGRVLVAGGYNTELGTLSTAEVYDPATDRFTLLSSQMSTGRELFTATPLNDGSILMAAGFDTRSRRTVASADLFDPTSMTFHRLDSGLGQNRFGQAAVRLLDGRVLIVGGKSWQVGHPDRPLAVAEIYDPATQRFHVTAGSMAVARDRPSATLLADGSVLIAGGQDGTTGPLSIERFDPSTETFTVLPHGLTTSRMAHGAVILPDGRVAIAGGWSPASRRTTATVEIFDPASDDVSPGPSMPIDAHDFALIAFPDGLLLVAGGKQARPAPASLASAATWSPTLTVRACGSQTGRM
ncbi:MAG: Kelch repeat-containing protein [Capsulimonadaceae bacterium]